MYSTILFVKLKSYASKSKQFSFFKARSPSFGGGLQNGKRKSARPIDPKSSIHLVLKASRAKGAWSLLNRRHKTRIQDLLLKLSKENGIKIYQFVNVGNHLHILLKTRDRNGFQRFLRIFSARVSMLITQAKKGNPQGRFWDELAFTRIVQWGVDFERITRYFIKNEMESFGYTTGFARELVQRGKLFFGSG